MKSYKVIALSVGGQGNKIFHSGNVVTENNFATGRADELVKLGFLEPLFDEKKIEDEIKLKEKIVQAKEDASKKAASDEEAKSKPAEKVTQPAIKSFDEITVKKLKKELEEKGVEIPKGVNKTILYELYSK